MAARRPAYLHRNRFGTLYVRRAVPRELTAILGRSELYLSLRTKDPEAAAKRALVALGRIQVAFDTIEAMAKKKNEDGLRSELGLFFDLDELTGRPKTMRVVDVRPEDLPILPETLKIAQEALAGGTQRRSDVPSRSATHGERVGALVTRYVEAQSSNWSQNSRLDIEGDLRQFVELAGDCVAHELTPVLLSGIQEKWLKMPANWRKVPEFRGKSVDEVLALRPTPQSPATVRKKWSRVSSFLIWCEARGLAPATRASAMKIKGRNESYEKFSDADLKKMFAAQEIVAPDEPFNYWVPHIALFTGARMEEICQLETADVFQEGGIWAIRITEEAEAPEANKRLKNSASARVCPLHSKLIDLGLLEFVRDLRERGHTRLFPELARANDGKVGGRASEWFTELRRRLGIGEVEGRSRKVFHSFRHTAIHRLQIAGVPQEIRERLAGHTSESVNVRVYGGNLPLAQLKPEMEKLCYPIELKKFESSARHERARVKGKRRETQSQRDKSR